MKLLIVNSRFLPFVGGGETYILELMQYFSDKGWDVHLVTDNAGNAQTKWRNCTTHYIDGFNDNFGNVLKSAPQMRSVLSQIEPDLVHVHNVMPYFIYSSVTDPSEFPTVLTIHNTPYLPKRLFGGFSNFEAEVAFCKQLFLNGHSHKILFGSRYYLDAYSKAIPDLKRCNASVAYYFPPRLTAGPFEPRTRRDRSARILFPSRILERKGIEDCLRAMALLPDNFMLDLPALSFQEAGGYNQQVMNLINELGLGRRIIMPNAVTTPDMMREHFAQADVVVIPSHYEGFGIVAVEALSWGVPIVTTGVGGLGEIIKNNENGLYVLPQNPGSLASAIQRVLKDEQLRNRIVRNGLDVVRAKFGYLRHMLQIEGVYHEALKTNMAPEERQISA